MAGTAGMGPIHRPVVTALRQQRAPYPPVRAQRSSTDLLGGRGLPRGGANDDEWRLSGLDFGKRARLRAGRGGTAGLGAPAPCVPERPQGPWNAGHHGNSLRATLFRGSLSARKEPLGGASGHAEADAGSRRSVAVFPARIAPLVSRRADGARHPLLHQLKQEAAPWRFITT